MPLDGGRGLGDATACRPAPSSHAAWGYTPARKRLSRLCGRQITSRSALTFSWENLLLTYRRAAKGKRGRAVAAAFEHRLEDNLLQLREELLAGTYRPGTYASFYIHDPKRRLISTAPFRDRVVHPATCNVIEPVFERSFIVDSYANRVGRGTHRALDRAQRFARRYAYVLQCDVCQFFPRIDHAILMEVIARKVPDPRVLDRIRLILDGGRNLHAGAGEPAYFPGDDLFAPLRPRGSPSET